MIIPNERWSFWRDQRPRTEYVHLDSAAAGRSSAATLRAVGAHAEREAVAGAYVAAAEASAVLEEGRVALSGLLGVAPAGIAFVESATAALAALLAAWPLDTGDTVAVVPSEWGPNLDAFANRGLSVAELATCGNGEVDLDALRRFVTRTPPAFVHLTQVASHRALVQPVAEAAAVCHDAGVPLWVDTAQALGHADTACGADALYATSRKWLTGPRGVGLIAVTAAWWDRLRISAPALELAARPEGSSPLWLLESREAHVAGRVGLCAAVRQHLDTGAAGVRQRLAEVGWQTREALAEVPGWEVVGNPAALSAITGLRPTAGQDVTAVRARLLAEYKIVTTAGHPARAPREMTEPLLRVSPHVDCTPEDLAMLCGALAEAVC